MANPEYKPVVLIVDDTPENLTVLAEALASDYRVRVANNGRHAIQVALSPPQPKLILLDVVMPDLDGYAVLEHLRTQPTTTDIPVIFVTAADSEADEEHGLALGAVDFIHKPIRPVIVQARVRTQLELKAARDALALRAVNLEVEVERRIRENHMIQDVSMRALASLAETRDHETGNHIRRTQHYVEVLARRLVDHPRFAALTAHGIIGLIVKAAPLHDIGKVGIPDCILLKPGPLTAEEWGIMQTHTRLGAEAIQRALADEDDQAPLAFLHIAMDIAHSHHEKWDGSGYPDGLKGESIPLPARLMALADVFDALISKRVYKEALPFDEAAAIIHANSGTHFDPAVVAAFDTCYVDFVAIAQRYRDD